MDEKKKISKNSISIIGGICFILFALVIMLSNGTPFSFLSIAITASFGFVGFWILMPFLIILGLFLIFKKKLIKFKVGMSLWGAFVIIVCFIILSSHWGSNGYQPDPVGNPDLIFDGISVIQNDSGSVIYRYLTFSTSVPVFQSRFADPSPFNTKLGGGYVGYILAGSMNSALTPVGLNIICWVFFIGGLAMLFNHQIKALIILLKKKIADKKNKKVDSGYDEITSSNDDEGPILDVPQTQPTAPSVPFESEVREDKPVAKPVLDDFPPIKTLDSGLKKAVFTLTDETVIEDTMVKKLEDGVNNQQPAPSAITEARFGENPETPTVASSEPENIVSEPVQEEVASEPIDAPSETYEVHSAPIVAPVEPEPVQEETIEEEAEPINRPMTAEELMMKPQPKANLIKDYIYPPLDLLDLHEEADDATKNEESCQQRTDIINSTFNDFNVGAQVVSHTVGPTVTRFDIKMNPGVSVNNVERLIQDISVILGGVPLRFEKIVAGKSTSGIEIPNDIRTNVGLRESIAALPTGPKYLLNIPFGRGIGGDLKHANMGLFPHMLVSGTTGSGKSIAVHSTILTLIMRNKPEELKLILIDPKKVEMSFYEDIPHLLCPIITDMRKSYNCLMKLVDEMERRYNIFQAHKLRDIKGFNEWAHANDVQPLPYIAIFVDEYADLVEQVKEIHEPIQRLVQKARAAGIHIVIATQRPSVNVIDGVIKSNFSTRLALLSASTTDSQTIIGVGGAEKLLGNGDMLIDSPLISPSTKPRVQGCFVTEQEINRVCDFLREHYPTQYDPYFLDLEDHKEESKASGGNEPPIEAIDKSANEEAQYQEIKNQIMNRDTCSISFIQRSFAMGFPRAGRIFNRLQKEGIVALDGDSRGNKVLVHNPINEQQIGTIEQSTFIPDDSDGDGDK